MFDYPLKKREILVFLGSQGAAHNFEVDLDTLVNDAVVFKVGEFYSLSNNFALAERRLKGNARAVGMLRKAEKAALIISHFPFVRGVAVSGSLSKNFADETADIDFFLITAPNRLWLARTFLHLFKKLTFLFRKQHYFCMNYFVDEEGLTILEKNIYTATEIATLLPLRGNAAFEKFYAANGWTKKILPNNYMRVSTASESGQTWMKWLLEKLLDNPVGNLLDSFLMKITAKSWAKKTRKRKRNSRGIVMGMHSGKHYSKPNPANFQQKLLLHYENDLSGVLDQYEHSSKLTNELL